jgi:hypothetical protein
MTTIATTSPGAVAGVAVPDGWLPGTWTIDPAAAAGDVGGQALALGLRYRVRR